MFRFSDPSNPAEVPPNSGQRATHAQWLSEARRALDAAAAELSRRSGAPPPVDRSRFPSQREEIVISQVGDVGQAAVVAEAVCRMGEELDALRVQVAALSSASKSGKRG